jgi:hypothetical protein
MIDRSWRRVRWGKVGYGILWLLGVPLPLAFFLFLVKGCH